MSSLLAWLSVALGTLMVAILLFLYLKGFFRHRPHYQIKHWPSPEAPNFALTVASLSDSFITQGTVTDFWVEADEINAARLAAIGSAQHSIQFETYIMTPGRRADDFAIALADKAQAGVRIQFIADHHGAHSIPPQYWERLRAVGVEVCVYNPFSWRHPLSQLKRNHRKLLIVDDEQVLIGGAGVSDYWDGKDKFGDRTPWRDYEVSLSGAVVARLKGIFIQHWLDAGGTANLAREAIQPTSTGRSTVLITSGEDPSYRDSGIRALYHSLIQAAKQRVWIASPYFLPDPNTREVIEQAQAQGVDVRVLTMGKRCDKRFVHYTSRELYGSLLKKGVNLYEYQPSMMHSKIVLIDNSWVSIGSANFDPRSFFQNDELNLSTTEQPLIQKIEQFFVDSFAQSDCISWQAWQQRPITERLIGRFWLLFYWQL